MVVHALFGRKNGPEGQGGADMHSMETDQRDKLEREDARQDALSDSDLRAELENKYGTTKWANRLVKSIMLGRRRKDEKRSD